MLHISETSSTRMPGYPAETCETLYWRSTDERSHEDGYEHLSAEEKLAAEESLSIYCKPVEFYNILLLRAKEHPLFLQRCLDYKVKAKHKKRIHMTVSLSWKDDEAPSVFPLCICLARLDPGDEDEEMKEYPAVYRTNQIFTFRGSSEIVEYGNTQVQASFMLPEVDKLAVEAKSNRFFILVFTSGKNPVSSSEVNASVMRLDVASNESRAGENCFLGTVCLKSIYKTWEEDPFFNLGLRTECRTAIDLLPCILKYGFEKKGKIISIQDPSDSEDQSMRKKILVSTSAEEFGARERFSYHIHSTSKVDSPSLSHIMRLKKGNVTFNYRYYNNKLQIMEVTEGFSCPFCLVGCASYKGLRCHLLSCHDFFNFEFSVSEDCPSVNVSVKTDIWMLEIVADGFDPKQQTFIFCANPLKRREPKSAFLENAKDTDKLVLEPEIPAGDIELLDEDNGSNAIILHPSLDCVPFISEHDHDTPEVPQVDKEEVSNAMILHPDSDCTPFPLISEHDHGAPAVLHIDKEEVSNAMILHPDSDCAPLPLISEHDHGAPAVLQVAPAVLQVDKEEVSNAMILHPDSDCAPFPLISEHDHGAPAVLKVDKGKLPMSDHDHGTPAMSQVDKKGRLSIEDYDPKFIARLMKRQFYHSRKYQPMALEEVLLDPDSEDEDVEEVLEIEERRMLKDLDVTDEQRQFMFMWNSFVRRHRVRVDCHVRWAYEAFTKFYCAVLAQSPALTWQWRLFMIKLWNHRLLDSRTINKCSIILQQYQKQNSDPES